MTWKARNNKFFREKRPLIFLLSKHTISTFSVKRPPVYKREREREIQWTKLILLSACSKHPLKTFVVHFKYPSSPAHWSFHTLFNIGSGSTEVKRVAERKTGKCQRQPDWCHRDSGTSSEKQDLDPMNAIRARTAIMFYRNVRGRASFHWRQDIALVILTPLMPTKIWGLSPHPSEPAAVSFVWLIAYSPFWTCLIVCLRENWREKYNFLFWSADIIAHLQ